MPELLDRAREVARNAAQSAVCGLAGYQRAAIDRAERRFPLYDGSGAEAIDRGILAALDTFCPTPIPRPIPSLPPQGGQCFAPYNGTISVRGEYERSGPFVTGGFFTGAAGPLTLVSQPETTPLGGTTWGYVLTDRNGNEVRRGRGPDVPPDNSLVFAQVSYGQITRADGGPDDCGSQTPDPPPASPRPPSTTINIDYPDIGPVTFTLTPIVGIINVDADATFNLPVTINVAAPTVDLDFNLEFDVDLSDPDKEPKPVNPDRPKNPDDRTEEPDCPPPQGCSDPVEEAEGGEPLEKTQGVRALIVLSVVDPLVVSATEILQEEGENVWAPYLGLARFKYERDDLSVVWSSDVPVKNVRAVVPAPQVGLRCIDAVFNPLKGVESEVFVVTGTTSVVAGE